MLMNQEQNIYKKVSTKDKDKDLLGGQKLSEI